MSNRHESFTAEYCPGETVTLYSQQHHTRIHLQTNGHTNNHTPLNQSKNLLIYSYTNYVFIYHVLSNYFYVKIQQIFIALTFIIQYFILSNISSR